MRIVVSGGGTGGHIYPALATVKQLKQLEPETEVLYIGGERGLKSQSCQKPGSTLRLWQCKDLVAHCHLIT